MFFAKSGFFNFLRNVQSLLTFLIPTFVCAVEYILATSYIVWITDTTPSGGIVIDNFRPSSYIKIGGILFVSPNFDVSIQQQALFYGLQWWLINLGLIAPFYGFVTSEIAGRMRYKGIAIVPLCIFVIGCVVEVVKVIFYSMFWLSPNDWYIAFAPYAPSGIISYQFLIINICTWARLGYLLVNLLGFGIMWQQAEAAMEQEILTSAVPLGEEGNPALDLSAQIGAPIGDKFKFDQYDDTYIPQPHELVKEK